MTKIIISILVAFLAIPVTILYRETVDQADKIQQKSVGPQEYTDDSVNENFNKVNNVAGLKGLVIEKISPKVIKNTGYNSTALDFDQAAFGALYVEIKPEQNDREVLVILSEKANQDGTPWVATENDHYPNRIGYYKEVVKVKKGERLIRIGGPERFRPSKMDLPGGLVSVFPFRYAEIIGKIEIIKVQQYAVVYPMGNNRLYFKSSNDVLNNVWALGENTIKATTFAKVFIDGNRERKPYEADAYINQLSYYALTNDNLLPRQTLNYLLKNPTWPTEWGFYAIFMAYQDYQRTGDKQYIKDIFERLESKLFIEFSDSKTGLISTRNEYGDKIKEKRGYYPVDIVDWPPQERDNYSTSLVSGRNLFKCYLTYFKYKSKAFIANVTGKQAARSYYNMQASNALNAAHVLPEFNTVVNLTHLKAAEHLKYLADEVGYIKISNGLERYIEITKKSIQDLLVDKKTKLYVDGLGYTHSSLHANMYALAFGLVPNENLTNVIDFVVSKGMSCSVFGSEALLQGLYKARRGDVALSLMTSKDDRGWWSMKNRTGSTMTLESWSNEVNPDSDWNHAWGTAPINIISRWLLGVRINPSNIKKLIIDPQPSGLNWFNAKIPFGGGLYI